MNGEEIRDRLAEALPESLGPASLRRPSSPLIPDGRPEPRGYGDLLLDALLPTVRAIAAEAASDSRAEVAAKVEALAREFGSENARRHTDYVADRLFALVNELTR